MDMSLQSDIEKFFEQDVTGPDRVAALKVFSEFKFFLNRGEVRAAEKTKGEWRVNHWVKKGILLGFRLGELTDMSINSHFRYFDKTTYPLKQIALSDGVREVPGGSAIRDGAFVARGVVCMPPMYINVGAYVDENTMVDSHALVGSCAQLGKRIHVSAAAQIGGVLEPVNALPVIIEDDVMVGGNCGIYEGTIVQKRAVIAAGVLLTGSTPVYDCINERIIRKSNTGSLVIPENAVVVAGSRGMTSDFARAHSLSLYTPLIVKYRDSGTYARTALEDALR